MAKNLIYGLMLLLYLLGTINGIGYSIYIGEWPTAIGVAVLSVMAFPTAKDMFYHLFIKDN
jgi:hypothetical protein